MPTTLRELTRYADQCLQPGQFRDYCPNGLQVEGRSAIGRLATGVTASQALLDEAVAWGADAILVHHGYFWQGENPAVVGMKRRRLATLLNSDTSLLAYHLPLDAHPRLGNNARLGQLLAIEDMTPLQGEVPGSVGNIGSLAEAVPAAVLVRRVEELTGREALHVGDPEGPVRRVAWCTGAAQNTIEAAVAAGADLFLTGEVSEQTVHVAREEGIHFVAAGHHATERYGVQALGEHLAGRFDLQHRFFDLYNPA